MGCGASSKEKKYVESEGGASSASAGIQAQASFFEKIEVKKHAIKLDYNVSNSSLGQGGFGKVCSGTRKASKDKFAIKQLPKEGTDLDAFASEIRISAELDHPNIVKLFEVFEDSKMFYLVLELCSGGELFDAIIEAQQFNEYQASHVMHQVMRGVTYMHKKCICHRDIKAENFLLSEKKAIQDANIKIIDFGIAMKFTPGTPLEGSSGTPYYIAPEVLKGSYDCTCDEWACGVLLYIMLSGEPPFAGRSNREILEAVRRGLKDNVFNSGVWPKVTSDGKDLVKKLICLDASRRMAAEKSLQHPWIVLHEKANPDQKAILEASALASLKSFSSECKLKKAALHAIARRMNEKDINDLKKMFVNLDKNEDGVVTFQELQDGIKNMGDTKEQTSNDIKKLLEELDVDGSASIDYTEFLAGTLSKRMFQEESILWSAFCVFDKDGSGKISRKELEAVLRQDDVQELMGSDNIEETIKKCDTNADGQIDFKEFMAMMK